MPTPTVDNAPPNLNQQRGWEIRSSDQLAVAAITALACALIVGSWVYRGGLTGRVIEIEQALPRPVTFQLDMNSAEWPEWTLLPGVGETLAKRIVQNREELGAFRSHEDLLRVSGVGPRTLDRMRPHLLSPNVAVDRPTEEVIATQ
ncbi:MAG: helix-hairpin-helix domain-containing protein [Planctomycetaceae bacterium]|nr:helix-hairpin-helix domain-containing protein [Planctomycetales bacterium]MCB9923634.1 helix-hairpin-helix domain-containing protein [Planctomycetaceae bacterium]